MVIRLSIFATMLSLKLLCVATLVLLLTLKIADTASAQAEYKVVCVGFYNLENLFDTEDDPKINDTEFTPEGANHYTKEIYQEKLSHLARVISLLGTGTTPDGVALLGVSEVENRGVLEDLIAQPQLADRHYQIVHYDSRDRRGIDVALLYQEKYFAYDSSTVVPLATHISENGDTSYSRDVLIVYGKLDTEPIAIAVNHWPSRYGGEKATAPLRNAVARINKTIVDRNTQAGINTILMGDLNDDPINTSVKGILRAKASEDKVFPDEMFNPMYRYYKRGVGTTAYQDAWSLFDQIILSSGFVNDKSGYHFYRAQVFNEPFLTQKSGRYKGYPYRTFSGNTYIGGYSDHFPVFVLLVKPI